MRERNAEVVRMYKYFSVTFFIVAMFFGYRTYKAAKRHKHCALKCENVKSKLLDEGCYCNTKSGTWELK